MIGSLLYTLLNVYSFILLARVILSWVAVGGGGISRDNPLVQAVHQLTDPPVQLIRQYMPQTGVMDFSVLVLFLIIYVLQSFVIRLPF
ncbi:MAG: YggT family protein [Cellvibrionaceae bacterium]|jgi:YggT family protein